METAGEEEGLTLRKEGANFGGRDKFHTVSLSVQFSSVQSLSSV